MRHSLLIISVIYVLSSCNFDDRAKQSIVPNNSVDTVKIAKQKEQAKYFSDLATTLKLLPIGNGADSFELRLWVSSMFVEHDLMILTFKNQTWESHKIRYYKSEDGVTHFKEREIKTKFSINNLVDSLKVVDFSSLPSQEEIKNFKDNIADGVTYNIEVATKSSYRHLSYHCPEHFAKAEINNKRFLDIIYLLDKHFRFWSPICVF